MTGRLSRRALLGAGVPFVLSARSLPGWSEEQIAGHRIFRKGTGPTVILLHEINGLSPGSVDFGSQLAQKFTVYMPLLFGLPMQDDAFLGYFEACWGSFSCSSDGTNGKLSGAAKFVRELVAELDKRRAGSIGVIGMCLTGSLPLYVMGGNVKAVVMSQPALPFGNDKQENVGASEAVLGTAKVSKVPILAFRFCADTICSGDRFRYLKAKFADQFQGNEFPTPAHFHPDFTHRAHAVLTGEFADATTKAKAREMVIEFFRSRLV